MSAGANHRPPNARSIPGWRRAIYALAPAIVLFTGLELTLRIVGFEYHSIPRHLQFGPNLSADIERNIAVPDADLFWRLRVGTDTAPWLIEQKHVHPALRAFTGADRQPSSPIRVIAMGDSCTFFGSPPYPRILERYLIKHGLDAEVFNASVPGYSSYQGRRWLEIEVADCHPDWIILYYGWNDHWLAMNAPDSDLARRRSQLSVVAERMSARIRTVQAGRALWARHATSAPSRRQMRVPIKQYRDNLRSICKAATSFGAHVLMITAPAELDNGDLERLRFNGYIAEHEDIRALHERYNDVARDVAASCGAILVDFAELASSTRGLVSDDGIHLEQRGISQLAKSLAEVIMADSE